jgi:hypothetical protein
LLPFSGKILPFWGCDAMKKAVEKRKKAVKKK